MNSPEAGMGGGPFILCLTYFRRVKKDVVFSLFCRFWLLLLLFFAAACNNDPQKKAAPPPLFLQATVSVEEGKEYVTCLLQFKKGEGRGVRLNAPASVSVNGEPLQPDSAGRNGIYYEAFLHPEDLQHSIIYTDESGARHTYAFTLQPLALGGEPARSGGGGDLTIPLSGGTAQDTVQVILVDTSFETDDINDSFVAENGQLIIPADDLRDLAQGPAVLELQKEVRQPLKEENRTAGRLVVQYSLRREFDLAP